MLLSRGTCSTSPIGTTTKRKLLSARPCILLANPFNPDSYKTRLDCYTFQIALFCKNPDCQKSNLLRSRFVLESGWKIVDKNHNNWSGISSQIAFIMLTQHWTFFWEWNRNNSDLQCRLKRIVQKNTRRIRHSSPSQHPILRIWFIFNIT